MRDREGFKHGPVSAGFGFELEEVVRSDELPFSDESPLEEAITQAKSFLEATLGSDDDLAEAASGTDPRAVASLREFIKTLADQDALCALEFAGKEFRYSDVGQVRQSLDRLRQDNIRESEEIIDGIFQGVLPPLQLFSMPSTVRPLRSAVVVKRSCPAAGPAMRIGVVMVMRRL